MEDNNTSTMINREYLISNIDDKIRSEEIRVSDMKDKINDLRMSIEYGLGLIAAYKDTKVMLEE